MKNLYPYAFKRKSFRRFNNELHITETELDLINLYLLDKVKNLNSSLSFDYRIVSQSETSCKRGEFCILIYSKINGPNLMNIGYTIEQLDLYLSSINIGVCWYGMGKIDERYKHDKLSYIIMLAIGKAYLHEFRKDHKKAKRKNNDEIWVGENIEGMVNYIKYAPSTCNSQPWLLTHKNEKIYVEMNSKEKMIVPKNKIGFYNSIDMGILLNFIDIWFLEKEIMYTRELKMTEEIYKSKDVVAVYTIKNTKDLV